MEFEIFILSGILLLNFFIFFSILTSRDRSSRSRKLLFAGMIFWVIVWVISILITDLYFNDVPINLWASRISFFSSGLIAIFYFLFIDSYRKDKSSYYIIEKLIWTPLVLFITGISLTNMVLESVEVVDGQHLKSHFGSLYLLFTLFISVNFIYSAIKFYRIFRQEENPTLRFQILYILLGTTASIFFTLTTNLFIPLITEIEIRSLGPLGLIFFLGLTYYAILRYRFLSLRIFVGKFVYFTFVSVVPYIAFFAIYLFQTETWGSIWDLKAIFSGYFIAAIFVYLLFLADNKVSHFVQKNIVYHSFDPEKLNKQLIDTVSKQLELEDVLNQVYEVIEKVFLPNSLDIYVFDNQNKVLSYRDEHLYIEEKVEPVFANIVKIIDDADDNEILMYNELLLQYIDEGIRGYSKEDIAAIVKFMKERKFEILLPYQQSKNQLRVLVFIGSKQTNSAYTIGELRFIKEIISSSNVAIERALYHQQVQDHAVRLKSEIDKATQELQLKNQQLEETLRKERDMMDILGHELRTPLTIGKNAMRYLKQDYEKDGTVTPEVMKKYLAMADENLTREARLLETLLSTTKIDNKAVNLHIEKADLVDAVNDSLDALRLKAEERGLQVIYNPPAESFIYADRNRTQEIVDNLIDNAIKYTKQGSITIEIIPGEKETAFRVTDTGVGIPEKDLEKLGQKFYRINTYLDSSIESDYKVVRPGGTGLGLYVTFSLVELMGGKVQVESEVGKGSIFTVTLPTYTGQAEKDNGYSNGKTVFERFEEMKKAKLDSSENLN